MAASTMATGRNTSVHDTLASTAMITTRTRASRLLCSSVAAAPPMIAVSVGK